MGKKDFPIKEGPADWTLCLSHARRRSINDAMLAMGSEVRHGTTLGDGPARVFQGLRLVGCGPPFRKGQIYQLSVNPWKVDDQPVAEAALRGLKLAYALTISSCQGMSLKGTVRILEGSHRRFGLKHLYVAASRACAARDLQVA